ncbi:hypothetical protein DPMN_045059 [Dreissena polymorpha]|uniref:Uncharacterized protein n=1 Tax=Dreissena polymorpha TaxID=45954 RepID=A0A9D4D5J3_DREPO|nr:hypothetical protein DPMN_045059 [Dreissena polymorpha]
MEGSLTASSKRHENLERYVKKQNLKVFNLEDNGNETQAQTEAKLIDAINSQLGLSENENSFDFAYRLSTKSTTRPVLIKCANMKIRDRIMANLGPKGKLGKKYEFELAKTCPSM